jgi:hypothetical protein
MFRNLVFFLLSLFALPAMASVDITEITAGVNDATTAVTAIGAAVLLIFLAIKLYKWIRRAL